uniref:Uncharacterized protein n=1 Tax=Anguilla anguilla TaxID=7936 RepID=A0A0E9SX27_ANGAN
MVCLHLFVVRGYDSIMAHYAGQLAEQCI